MSAAYAPLVDLLTLADKPFFTPEDGTSREAIAAGKGRGGMMPLKIVLLKVRGLHLNGCYELLYTARIIHFLYFVLPVGRWLSKLIKQR